MAETVTGRHETEIIRRLGPWRSVEATEIAAREWIDWFNHRRLLKPIGNLQPAGAGLSSHAELETRAVAA